MGEHSARLCWLLLVHGSSQSLGVFIQDAIHRGQILQLADVHAFNPSLRSFLSPSDEWRDFLLSCCSVWNEATGYDGEEEDRTGGEVKGERQTRHCSFMAELAEKGLPWQHLHFNERGLESDFAHILPQKPTN